MKQRKLPIKDRHTFSLPGFEPPDQVDGVDAVEPTVDLIQIADALPPDIRLGTSSWHFPGWTGIVWKNKHPKQQLARHGLRAYSAHPLLATVGVDRTYYRPLSANEFALYREAVTCDFQFVVKAHEHTTTSRFSKHARYGALAGTVNRRFLDATYAIDAVVGPTVDGLQDRFGVLVFQFPPQSTELTGSPGQFAERAFRFFDALPKGPRYAAEIRNANWLTADYVSALAEAGVIYCLTVHPRMPSIHQQIRIAAPAMGAALVCRWNLGHGFEYEAAKARYAPFDQVVDEDMPTREALAELCITASNCGQPVYVIINNKAEGSAPLSAFALASRIVNEAT